MALPGRGALNEVATCPFGYTAWLTGLQAPLHPRHATRPCGPVRFKAATRRLGRCPSGSLEPANPARHAHDALPRWRGEWLGHSPRAAWSFPGELESLVANGGVDDAEGVPILPTARAAAPLAGFQHAPTEAAPSQRVSEVAQVRSKHYL